MLESIIQFINLKLSLLNYFEKRHCLTTLVKNDDGLIYPAEYISNGDFDAIDFDGYDGVSYMRVNGEVDIARTDQQYTPKPRLEVSFPLKLVYAVRKDKLTQDDAYSWDRVRASIAKQLETDSKDLANTLDADLVQISTSSYMSDTKEIWDEETAETGQFQPKFEVVFGSMEVTVTVTTRAECIPAECDDFESDILKSFDFCSTTVQGRLTPEQITCLTDWLCGLGDPVTIQINGVTYTTAEAGSTFDQQIVNTDADAVGTAANPSVVGDSTITINGDSLGATGSVIAEGSLNIEVNLDGNPSGSWDGDSWEVTSAACDDATVNINTIFMDNVASGDTLDLEVRQETGATQVGSKQGQHWRIDDADVENSDQSYQSSVVAEGTLVLPDIQFTDSDGSTSSVPSVKNIVATPCASSSVSIEVFSDSGLTNSITSTSMLETVYIVATVTGFTANSYSFYIQTATDSIPVITQASGTLAWEVSLSGVVKIVCIATNGVDSTCSENAFELTVAGGFIPFNVQFSNAATIFADTIGNIISWNQNGLYGYMNTYNGLMKLQWNGSVIMRLFASNTHIGFAITPTGITDTTGFYINPVGNIRVYENGVNGATLATIGASQEDVWSVVRGSDAVFRYYRNDVLVYTSTYTYTDPMHPFVRFGNNRQPISNVYITHQ